MKDKDLKFETDNIKEVKPENPIAFPTLDWYRDENDTIVYNEYTGMTLLDYFIAHAPENPQWDFDVPMETKRPKPDNAKENSAPGAQTICINADEIRNWDDAKNQKKIQMWASEWAKTQLKMRQNHL